MRNQSLQSWGLAILRVVVGVTFFLHGWQKLTVMHVAGVTGMLSGMGVPLPNVAAVALMTAELIGGALLIIGLFTRWAALLNGFDMLVAILLVHLQNGFFNPKGVELPLTLLAATVCLALAGPGAASLDAHRGHSRIQVP